MPTKQAMARMGMRDRSVEYLLFYELLSLNLFSFCYRNDGSTE